MMFRNHRFITMIAAISFCTLAYFGLTSTAVFAATAQTTTPITTIAQLPTPGAANQPNQPNPTNQCNPTNQPNRPNPTNQCNQNNQPNPAPTNACPPTISEGAQGTAVQTLQAKLNIPVSGVFDAQTLAAVKQFQAQHNLPVDGVVGQSTWHALGVC